MFIKKFLARDRKTRVVNHDVGEKEEEDEEKVGIQKRLSGTI